MNEVCPVLETIATQLKTGSWGPATCLAIEVMVIFCKSLRYDFSLAGPEGKNKVNNHHWIQRPVLEKQLYSGSWQILPT
jgi:hypothetical protein